MTSEGYNLVEDLSDCLLMADPTGNLTGVDPLLAPLANYSGPTETHALQAGTVWINAYNLFDAASPFGGYKASGFGREMGKEALDLYTQVKSVWVAY